MKRTHTRSGAAPARGHNRRGRVEGTTKPAGAWGRGRRRRGADTTKNCAVVVVRTFVGDDTNLKEQWEPGSQMNLGPP